jgi:hypothetical protein
MMSQEVTHKGLSMSINGVDYTKQLAKDREYFQDANKKLRDSTEKRIDDTEKRSEHVMTKQRENFIEDKAELESAYQKNADKLKDKTKSSLEGSSSKFQEELVKERENFTQDSLKKSKDFDQRLNDIKSSYGKSFNSEKDRHEDLEKTMKNKFGNNVNELRNDSDEKLKDYQDRMSGAGASLKDQYNRERQQLVRAQEDRLTDAYKDSAHKRTELKDRISTENKKAKEVQESELAHQKRYTQDRLGTMQGKYQDRFDSIAKDYSERSDNLVEAQQRNAVKINRENQEKVTDIRRDYNDSLRQMDLQKRREDTGSGEFAEVVSKQQGNKDHVIHNNKVKNLREELVEAQRSYQHRASNEQTSFNDTLKEQASEATAREDRKLNEANANKIITVAHEREKSVDQLQNREHQNRLDKSAYEAQLMNERNNSKQRLDSLKENFNKSMMTLEEKNKLALDDVTKTSNQDKKEFMKKVQEVRSNEIFGMKREFGKMMDSTVQDYEQRLNTYQRDNEYLKLTMDQKIQNITDQTQKQLDSQRTLFEDRRSADVKGQQILMDQRESQLKKNFAEMNMNYQKKIDKLQISSDSKLKLITNDYESKLKELKATTSKDLAVKDTDHNIELDRIKQTYDDEKTRLVSSYENQIQAMKNGHKEQMDTLAEYKKLS